jgi:hypothetical protein
MTSMLRRIEGLKTIPVAGIALLLFFHSGGTFHPAGAVCHQKPFQVRADLEWRFPSHGNMNHAMIWPDEHYYNGELPLNQGTIIFAEKAGKSLDVWQYQKLKVYLSRLSLDVKDIDAQGKSDDAANKINTFIALPSMLMNDQYGDVLKSMGEIFKPQLNLGIEF